MHSACATTSPLCSGPSRFFSRVTAYRLTAIGGRRAARSIVRAGPELGTDREEKASAPNGADPLPGWLGSPTNVEGSLKDNGSAGEMPAEQQRLLGQLYRISVQDPDMRLMNLNDLKAASDLYQLLLWRPAELLNGRMAMIGFVTGVGRELLTGETIWAQLARNPFAYLLAYSMVVGASLLNRAYGSPTKGIGPFTRTAELWNGRAAMVGFAIQAYLEYNVELRKAAFLYLQQLQHMQVPGINT